MLQRVMPDLMGMKNILVLNDEAHHCYREKPDDDDDEDLKGDERKEAEKNNEAARLWISGLEAVNRKLGVARVIDLSATPFFLRGSGYAEGTLFPWTMSDFSLMDAIECGIVKLPRVPVADNIPGDEMPMFRNLWEHIGKEMPKKGRGKAGDARSARAARRGCRPRSRRSTATTRRPSSSGRRRASACRPASSSSATTPSTSKLVYDYISGFHRENEDGTTTLENGRLALFRNFDEHGNPLPRPNTLLIDSEQLESGEALDDNFREMAADEIERFRREIVERTGDRAQAENITDQDLLREVMNTVGKQGRLGEPHPLRRLGLHAHRGLGRQHRHPRPRRPRLRHPAPLRAGHRPRAAPPVLRPERGGPVQRRVRRHPRHPVRLHGQAGRRAAAAAARDHPGQGGAPRARRARDPLPARRGLPRRAAGGAADRRVQRRLRPGADARPRRPVDHAERRASSARAST